MSPLPLELSGGVLFSGCPCVRDRILQVFSFILIVYRVLEAFLLNATLISSRLIIISLLTRYLLNHVFEFHQIWHFVAVGVRGELSKF